MEECNFGLACKGNYVVTQYSTLNLLDLKTVFQSTAIQDNSSQDVHLSVCLNVLLQKLTVLQQTVFTASHLV